MGTSKQVRSFEDLSFLANCCKRVLTLFSGGLDSTYVLQELRNRSKDLEIICLTVDLGDGVNQDDLRSIAKQFDATSIVVDGKERFVREAVLPAMQANARYMGIYPISSSLSRPIIMEYACEYACKLDCQAVIHTANQSQNSLRRLNGAVRQLNFDGYYGTPYEFSVISRVEKIEKLRKEGLERFQARGVSGDANLWVREFESGSLENPESFEIPEDLLKWTATCSSKGRSSLRLDFYEGRPVAINGSRIPPVALIAQLNGIAGCYQIGRYAGLEHLDGDEKVLEVREAPAACMLMDAYRHLETASLGSELLREKLTIEQIWVREAVEGRWFSGMRAAASAFIASTAEKISGHVEYILRPGGFDVSSIVSRSPLYLTDRDAWEQEIAKVRGSRSLEAMQSTVSVPTSSRAGKELSVI